MSRRNQLLATYFCSMVCLSLLNVFLSVVPNRLSDNGTNLLYSLLAQIFCMGVIPLLGGTLTYWGKGGTVAERMSYTLRRWGYRAPKDKRVWLPVVLLSVSFIYVTQLVARIGNLALMLGQYTFSASGSYVYNNVGELLMWIAVGSLLPATFEELTHRGLVIDAIGDGGNEIEQMLLCGLLFALMHTNILQFLYAFAGGCMMAFLTIKTKSILPAMLLHFVNNTYSHLSSYASQNPDSVLGWMDVVSDFFTSNIAMLLLGGVLLVGNVVLALYLLTWVQKTSGVPEGLREVTLLRFGRKKKVAPQAPVAMDEQTPSDPAPVITLDAYRPFGKAKLSDNIFLAGVVTTTALTTVFTYVWGVVR